MAHGFRGLLETVAEHPCHGDHLLAAQAHVDEDLYAGRGFAVGPQQDGRVGIVGPRHAECALDRLQQLQIDAGFIADLAGRHMTTVVADDATRRQQHRRNVAPNLFDGETLLSSHSISSARSARACPSRPSSRPDASMSTSSATAPTYTAAAGGICFRDHAAAAWAPADHRRRCPRPDSRQHAQRDVSGRAAVLRQSAKRVLADHRRDLRVRRRRSV